MFKDNSEAFRMTCGKGVALSENIVDQTIYDHDEVIVEPVEVKGGLWDLKVTIKGSS